MVVTIVIIIIIVIVVPVVLAAKKPDVTVLCGFSLCTPNVDCPPQATTPGVRWEFIFKVKNNAIADGSGRISQLTIYDETDTAISTPGYTGNWDLPKNKETTIWGTNWFVFANQRFWESQVWNSSAGGNTDYKNYTVRLRGSFSADMSTFSHTVNIDQKFTFPSRAYTPYVNGTCPV